jgi:glutaminyl-tRNA synthetase
MVHLSDVHLAHPIEDALEQITHSIATLEFEDQRPFYDWLLYRLAEGGLIASPHPRQYEFARLNVTHGHQQAQAAPAGRRRARRWLGRPADAHPRRPPPGGYTPEALRLFCERSGVTKSGGWIDYASLEATLRDTLDPIARARWPCSTRSSSSSPTGPS